jgi:hypothetical protein
MVPGFIAFIGVEIDRIVGPPICDNTVYASA